MRCGGGATRRGRRGGAGWRSVDRGVVAGRGSWRPRGGHPPPPPPSSACGRTPWRRGGHPVPLLWMAPRGRGRHPRRRRGGTLPARARWRSPAAARRVVLPHPLHHPPVGLPARPPPTRLACVAVGGCVAPARRGCSCPSRAGKAAAGRPPSPRVPRLRRPRSAGAGAAVTAAAATGTRGPMASPSCDKGEGGRQGRRVRPILPASATDASAGSRHGQARPLPPAPAGGA